MAVGIFAVGEALWVAAHLRRKAGQVIPVGRPWMGREDWKRSWKPWLRGTALGFPFGAMPAGGAEIPTLLSYPAEKALQAPRGVRPRRHRGRRRSGGGQQRLGGRHPRADARARPADQRHRGHHAGALQGWGIEPGPLLLDKEPALVWALIASLFIGNTMLLVLNLPLAPAWAKLLQIPRPYLYAGILFFACMGAYAVNAQPFDLWLLLGLGLLGFAMRRFGLPVLPLIVGVILGPLVERKGRQSLQLTGGDISGLVGGPVAWFCYVLIVIALAWPLIGLLRGRGVAARRSCDDGTAGAAPTPRRTPCRLQLQLRRPDMTVLVGFVPNAARRGGADRGGRRGASPRRAVARRQHVARRRPRRRAPRRAEQLDRVRRDLAELDLDSRCARSSEGSDAAEQISRRRRAGGPSR